MVSLTLPFPLSLPSPFPFPYILSLPVGGKVRSSEGEVPRLPPLQIPPERNAEYTRLVYLALMLFVYPRLSRLYIDVVQFCSKFASCHFAEKPKLRQPQSTFNRKSDCWRYTHVMTWGGGAYCIVSAPSPPLTPKIIVTLLSN